MGEKDGVAAEVCEKCRKSNNVYLGMRKRGQ